MRSAVTYNPKGSFPPTLNAQKFHPTQNVPTTVNGFYNPNYRLKDETLVRPVLSPSQRRSDSNNTQISLRVKEHKHGGSSQTGGSETTMHNRFKTRSMIAEEFSRKNNSVGNNFDPERSLEYVNRFRASTAKSSSSISVREKRYSVDGLLGDASMAPLMKQSFSFNSEYVDPVETKDASTETVSGLLKKRFDSMKDIGHWEKNVVDPFLFNLKKAIMHTKPEFLEEFIIGFCSREAMNQPHPDFPKSMKVKREQKSILRPEMGIMESTRMMVGENVREVDGIN